MNRELKDEGEVREDDGRVDFVEDVQRKRSKMRHSSSSSVKSCVVTNTLWLERREDRRSSVESSAKMVFM